MHVKVSLIFLLIEFKIYQRWVRSFLIQLDLSQIFKINRLIDLNIFFPLNLFHIFYCIKIKVDQLDLVVYSITT